ncbi:hypothetical protein AMTRI_Chr06g191440 [Amborella trichopoda]
MAKKKMELTLLSGKGLKAFNFFRKLSVFAEVSVGDQKTKQKIPADKIGDGNPEWKHAMTIDLDDPGLDQMILTVKLKSEGLFERLIGEVHIPVQSLLEEGFGVLRYVSYQVSDPNGKPNGVLSLSYKITGNFLENETFPGKSEILATEYAAVVQENGTFQPETDFPSKFPGEEDFKAQGNGVFAPYPTVEHDPCDISFSSEAQFSQENCTRPQPEISYFPHGVQISAQNIGQPPPPFHSSPPPPPPPPGYFAFRPPLPPFDPYSSWRLECCQYNFPATQGPGFWGINDSERGLGTHYY